MTDGLALGWSLADGSGVGWSVARPVLGGPEITTALVEALAPHGIAPLPGVAPWDWLRAALADRGLAYELESATGRLRVVVTAPDGHRSHGRAGELPEGLGWALVRLLESRAG